MLTTITTILVQILGEFASTVTTSSQVGTIISALTNLIPALVGELASLITPVKNIIAALQSGSVALTTEQIVALTALDTQCDAQIDATAKADGLTIPTDS